MGAQTNEGAGWIAAIVCSVVFAGLAYLAVSFSVLIIRLVAQLSLCLERIEANSRPAPASAAPVVALPMNDDAVSAPGI